MVIGHRPFDRDRFQQIPCFLDGCYGEVTSDKDGVRGWRTPTTGSIGQNAAELLTVEDGPIGS